MDESLVEDEFDDTIDESNYDEFDCKEAILVESNETMKAFMQQASLYPILPNEEVIHLLEIGTPEAKEKVVNHNLKLVIYIARRYINRGVAIEDLIQEGNMGLMRATEDFDSKKYAKFATYAYYWIRQKIQRYITNHAKTIRVPAHIVFLSNQVYAAQKELTVKLGQDPTVEQIAEKTNLPIEKVTQLLKKTEILSLDMDTNDESDTSFYNLVSSDQPAPEQCAIQSDLKDKLNKMLSSQLSEKEKIVITMYYGLDNGEKKPYREIAEKLNLTRVRVKSIHDAALLKLKNPENLEILKDFLQVS